MNQPCASFYMRCLTRTTDLGTWKHIPAYSSCESSIGTVTIVIGSDGCIHARQAEHRWRAASPAAIPWASSCAVRGQSSSSVLVSHLLQIILTQSVPRLQKRRQADCRFSCFRPVQMSRVTVPSLQTIIWMESPFHGTGAKTIYYWGCAYLGGCCLFRRSRFD